MPILPLEPNTILNSRYLILKLIGYGGFGNTYAAHDRSLNNDCVVKEFALDLICTRDTTNKTLATLDGREKQMKKWVGKFVDEARNLAKIRHPGIVTVFDVWLEKGTAFYAMEYIKGGELPDPSEATWQARDWTEVKPIAIALLKALAAVHKIGLLHGDIKPANILIDEESRMPILIDFGTARSLEKSQKKTATSMAYTKGYAPIELQDRDRSKEANSSSDLYSWAMVVIGMVKKHHNKGTPLDAETRIILSEVNADKYSEKFLLKWLSSFFPVPVISILASCLLLDPKKRPKSANIVLKQLENSDYSGSQQLNSENSALIKLIARQQEVLKQQQETLKQQQQAFREEKNRNNRIKNVKPRSRKFGVKTVLEENLASQAPPLKNVLIVGRNGYITINKALQAASDQTIIKVMPGIYRESLVLNKSITIIGIGKVEEIVIIGSKNSTILSTKNARLENVTLKNESSESACVQILSGKIQIEKCDISGGKNCIVIQNSQTKPVLRDNRIHNAKKRGIFIFDYGEGIIEKNNIFSHGTNGVVISSNADPIIRDNNINDNTQSGIWVYNNGKSIIEKNDIFNNNFSGISVKSGAIPIIHHNRIYNNTNYGIKISNAEGTFEHNHLFQNKKDNFFQEKQDNKESQNYDSISDSADGCNNGCVNFIMIIIILFIIWFVIKLGHVSYYGY